MPLPDCILHTITVGSNPCVLGAVFRGAGAGRERVTAGLSVPYVDAVHAGHLHDLIHRALPQFLHPRLLHRQDEQGW